MILLNKDYFSPKANSYFYYTIHDIFSIIDNIIVKKLLKCSLTMSLNKSFKKKAKVGVE